MADISQLKMNDAAEELTCAICHMALADPVETHCQQIMCRTCVTDWHNEAATCPWCRSTDLSLRPIHPRIRAIIERVTAVCENAANGCTEELTMDEYADHVNNNCGFKEVPCPWTCGNVLKKDLAEDNIACPMNADRGPIPTPYNHKARARTP